ncbi:CoA transferase [Humibacter sp.]|uniref:CaiB/BaiF CoA transferase family protein n=1 Tax=Humibacter sp. TaxID=1940291 RepID=UPI002CE173DC|nr:CoA transferase [Humibacter sp.]HVX09154.1 CoA transferase [Humibacter sp.]
MVDGGILRDLDVLDLSWGISGPMTGMLLADHGARVTRIEPPTGDPFADLSGTRVWLRGKRRATLDLRDAADRDVFLALARKADVVIESFAPGVAAKLGIDHSRLLAANPRLIHCSITGYGETGAHAGRPAYDALVAARTGQQFESRGVVGTTIGRLSGTEVLPGYEGPEGSFVGADRPGPLFSGIPWISLATFYNASVAINAALVARETTGRGQHVHTSLLQGALATTFCAWQRVERADRAGFNSWIFDPRAPKGFYRGADGKWTHHWVPLPSFILRAAELESLDADAKLPAPRDAPMRISPGADDMVVLHAYHQQMSDAVAKFPAADWAKLAARVGVPVQEVRSPEDALRDPLLLEDGCVVEVDGVRMVGRTYQFEKTPAPPIRGVAAAGEHTDDVRREAQDAPFVTATSKGRQIASPLEGVVVLDLGLAVAGPYGTQLLSDLGANVIKVNNPLFDSFWLQTSIGMACNRGKQAITIDLKTADGMATLHDLVRTADVVQHNMRYDAAERLGVDYESLKKVNPDLIYCHTRGHDPARMLLPGNDQTAAALAGASWMEGGAESGATPIWPNTSLGDTGNGFLSAIAILQALYHRNRTGEGQYVETSILYAHLLNTSLASVDMTGAGSGRPILDAEQLGWNDRYRLHETADGWLCVALATDQQVAHFQQITSGDLRTRSASQWFKELDAAGVPCEVADEDFVLGLYDDPEMIAKRWVVSYEQPLVGRMDVAGLLFDLEETPGVVQGPPIVMGQDTRRVLERLGYDDARIDDLIASGAVAEAPSALTS